MTAAKRYRSGLARRPMALPPIEPQPTADERVAYLRSLGAAECRACEFPVYEHRLTTQGVCQSCDAEGCALCSVCGIMAVYRELPGGRCWGCPAPGEEGES